MCDPLTLVSIAVGAAGAVYQGNAAASAARYNAQIAEMNAKISDKAAKDALERGARDEQRKRIEVAAIAGQQRAGMAASGIDISFGTPLEMLVDTAYAGEMDALTVRTNANREAYNQEVQSANLRAQSGLYQMEAKSARTGSMLSAIGGGLSTGASAYGKFADTYGRAPTMKDMFSFG